jgi:hypothetical protein
MVALGLCWDLRGVRGGEKDLAGWASNEIPAHGNRKIRKDLFFQTPSKFANCLNSNEI